jgi:hypothetical protein
MLANGIDATRLKVVEVVAVGFRGIRNRLKFRQRRRMIGYH